MDFLGLIRVLFFRGPGPQSAIWTEGMYTIAEKRLETETALFSCIDINLHSLHIAIDSILDRLRRAEGFMLFTLNLDHIAKLRKDRAFLDAYRQADLVSADGWPVVWHGRRNGLPLQRTTGADLVEPLCEAAAAEKFPLFFVGPLPDDQAKAIRLLQGTYPGLIVAGAEAPLISLGDDRPLDALAQQINGSQARLCFLSLGAPKQELLAAALRARCPDVGFACVGAALDFIAGSAIRAPMWIQDLGCEWLWRLASDPRRLFLRYVDSAFMLLLIGLGRNPIRDQISRDHTLDPA
jgi:N-acetylglucosaminyldiphosphoundecaprenol N-acetyl-beta-D-mannosaminyltransferase